MINIEKETIYIKKIISVLKSELTNKMKLRPVDGRFSDAFIYIISGSCTYKFFDEREFTVNEGDVLYLAKDAKYYMNILSDNFRFICCNFDFISDDLNRSSVFTTKNPSLTENLFYNILKLYISSNPSFECECLSLLYKIYADIIRAYDNIYIQKEIKSKIVSAKEYIDINLKDTLLSVTKVCDYIGVSEVYFRKLFKLHFGISPSQYIINKRIENAKLLMKHQYLTLDECALQSGFSSLQYFCRIFKKLTGITPSKYRNLK